MVQRLADFPRPGTVEVDSAVYFPRLPAGINIVPIVIVTGTYAGIAVLVIH